MTRATSARLNTGPWASTVIQSMTAPRSGPGARISRSAPFPVAPPAISPRASAAPRPRARSPAPAAVSVATAPASVITTISAGRLCPRPKATPVLRTSSAQNGPNRACGPQVPLHAASAIALVS
ncbi:hypothetical protein IGW14_04680 [Streptomyces hygroscopicus subsp. hygroscopicus]|uniref:Uncharacterized protein n=1 Tax=Streptomyces demainii TaxID=588122 RepID=A0ABT9KKQ8_9ACTN|nr:MULTISPECIES: hypothetical protein [Streptomyces]MBW8087359.1 hypothetical protein [Streptomyces hygroscopicus subsp. hygroscopicus]MDP9609015.1 hypothetical protein [Streptomyces demainii]